MPDDKESVKKAIEEPPVELESQIILRIPPTPAASLRAAVRSGVMNLKDRLSVQLEPDMRHGTVKFDKWYLSAKVLDLPTVVEMHKSLDRKTFYKTADICQIMICKEEDDGAKTDEEESPKKKEKKDSKDKKFLYPHGLTPPLKNVRKRRFRKTLKKKYVDFPEIEKEVKRLFRMDNEAINVRYEIVNADDEKNDSRMLTMEGMSGSAVSPGPGAHLINSNSQSFDVAEHDLFGDVVSSSEEDVNIVDSGEEDNSRPYPGRSYISQQEEFITEFSKEMLESPEVPPSEHSQDFNMMLDNSEETAAAEQSLNQLVKHEMKSEQDNSGILNRLADLEQEIAHLQAQKRSQEVDIAAIENQALKQRFQNRIDSLRSEISDKQHQLDEIVMLLHST